MRSWNWFTVAALLSAIAIVTVGTILVITQDVTLDHIAGLLVIGTPGVIAAILSLHLADRE